MAHLITGRAGKAHVTAADEAKINKSIYGNTEAAVNHGNKLALTLPSSNKVSINTGLFYMQGRWIDLPAAETLTLDNGNSGMNRNDIVVIRYSADSGTGIEKAELAIVKGTPSTSAKDPELRRGDIDGGALINECPLYRIPLAGINVGTPVQLFQTMKIKAEVDGAGNEFEKTYAKKSELGDQIRISVSGNKCIITRA